MFVSAEKTTNCVNCRTQHLFGNMLGNIHINCLAHLPSYSPNYMQERSCLLARFRKLQPEVSLFVVKNLQSHLHVHSPFLVQ
jgi:hypothetical protein